ncbi:MAG: hypothetical protein KF730_17220 [Sphingomonas sp.]|uniref:hypothetical protein n=1 Tax=Sphingomonas sp. TaxID=28214 RepID=UPI0025E5C8F2|nr:hypothetical protein [Sphingomonas sp.]MBX3566303.1 hypothetical protein [Sphingomonas sp.]
MAGLRLNCGHSGVLDPIPKPDLQPNCITRARKHDAHQEERGTALVCFGRSRRKKAIFSRPYPPPFVQGDAADDVIKQRSHDFH